MVETDYGTTLHSYDDVMEAYGDDPTKAEFMLEFLGISG